MKRIAITGAKGGVGKTFVACNLAFYVQRSKISSSPCLVDFGAGSPASAYISHDQYNQLQRHSSEFVYSIEPPLVVACCEDWDKFPEQEQRGQAFGQILSDPQSGGRLLSGLLGSEYGRVEASDFFIYDTDHYIASFIKFLHSMDKVVLLVDHQDEVSMENLAKAWLPYSNAFAGKLVSKKPRRTYILGNRTGNPEKCLKVFLDCAKRVFRNTLPDSDCDRLLAEMDALFLKDLTIPRVPSGQARKSYLESIPIWELGAQWKDPFKRLAAKLA